MDELIRSVAIKDKSYENGLRTINVLLRLKDLDEFNWIKKGVNELAKRVNASANYPEYTNPDIPNEFLIEYTSPEKSNKAIPSLLATLQAALQQAYAVENGGKEAEIVKFTTNSSSNETTTEIVQRLNLNSSTIANDCKEAIRSLIKYSSYGQVFVELQIQALKVGVFAIDAVIKDAASGTELKINERTQKKGLLKTTKLYLAEGTASDMSRFLLAVQTGIVPVLQNKFDKQSAHKDREGL